MPAILELTGVRRNRDHRSPVTLATVLHNPNSNTIKIRFGPLINHFARV